MKPSFALKLPLLLIVLAGIALPYLASASTLPPASNVWDISTLAKPLLICQGGSPSATSGGTQLPTCQDVCDLVAEFENVLYIMIAYAIWVIAPIAFIGSGIMFMLSGANEKLRSTAKDALKGTIIGIVIVLCSYIIIFTVVNIFSGLSNYIGGFGASCSISSSQ